MVRYKMHYTWQRYSMHDMVAYAICIIVQKRYCLIHLRGNIGDNYMSWYSFIHSGHFYSAPSSPLPLSGAPDYSTDTVSEFHAEAHRQLQVKDLPKVPT